MCVPPNGQQVAKCGGRSELSRTGTLARRKWNAAFCYALSGGGSLTEALKGQNKRRCALESVSPPVYFFNWFTKAQLGGSVGEDAVLLHYVCTPESVKRKGLGQRTQYQIVSTGSMSSIIILNLLTKL